MSVEERYRALVEHSHEVTCLLDAETKCVWVSPSVTSLLGYGVDEYAASALAELVHPDDLAALEGALRRVREQPAEPLTLHYRVRHKNGRWHWLEATLSNRIAHPDLGALVLNQRDVTDRRLLEERVQLAQKLDAVGRLAGGIAHDFNNMLSAISGFTNLALGQLAPNDAAREELAEVLDAATRATLLTRQLLAFSRQQILQPRVFDLREQVRRMEPMLRRTLGEDIELRVDTPALAVTIKADVAQIEQVLLNLAINARNAMPAGGRLDLEVGTAQRDEADLRAYPDAQPGLHALLRVRDSGEGMTPEVRARIFEPFYTTSTSGGAGLGLSTVYGIVTQSRGHLAVSSQPGAGTSFEVYLPICHDELPAEPPVSAAGAAGNETILLVEDEAAVRRYASRVLRGSGYQVIEAGSGREALGLAGGHDGAIDLLFTDVVMPGMSGPQLAERLVQARPALRVLYTSGYAATVIERHGVLDEKFDLVEKPVAPQALLAKVRELLDRQQSRVLAP